MATSTMGSRALLTPSEVAGQLRVAQQTLYAWRTRGVGPRALKVGRHLRYRPEDVEAWLYRDDVDPVAS